jgi:hypothetical protein
MSQAKRINVILKKCWQSTERHMGYNSVDNIGVHSIQKGASWLQGSWTMGCVAGDDFTGRCICLLMKMMSSNFASLLAFFAPDTDEDWMKTNMGEVFPHFEAAEGMGRLLWMCLASLVQKGTSRFQVRGYRVPPPLSKTSMVSANEELYIEV